MMALPSAITEPSTSHPTIDSPTADSAVAWRRLSPTLWVGRRDDEFIGSIERGRHFRALDPDGGQVGVFHDFATAEAALDGSMPPPDATEASEQEPLPRLAWVAASAGAVAVALGVVGVLLL